VGTVDPAPQKVLTVPADLVQQIHALIFDLQVVAINQPMLDIRAEKVTRQLKELAILQGLDETPPAGERTIKELINEAIDAGAPINTPLQDGAISGAKLKKRPVPHTELTIGIMPNLLSVPALFEWINGGKKPPFIPYIVWIPIDVHERTRT
jgi:hypothetical protein